MEVNLDYEYCIANDPTKIVIKATEVLMILTAGLKTGKYPQSSPCHISHCWVLLYGE